MTSNSDKQGRAETRCRGVSTIQGRPSFFIWGGKILKIKIWGGGNLYFIEAFFLFGGGVKIENWTSMIQLNPVL